MYTFGVSLFWGLGSLTCIHASPVFSEVLGARRVGTEIPVPFWGLRFRVQILSLHCLVA